MRHWHHSIMYGSADIATTTVTSILIITCIVGNSLVCVIIKKHREMRYMHMWIPKLNNIADKIHSDKLPQYFQTLSANTSSARVWIESSKGRFAKEPSWKHWIKTRHCITVKFLLCFNDWRKKHRLIKSNPHPTLSNKLFFNLTFLFPDWIDIAFWMVVK